MSLMICYPVRPLVKQSEAMVLRFQCVFLKLLFKYNCLHFHITTHPCHTHSCLPPSNLPPSPFGFVHVSFIHVPWWSFLYYPSPPSSLDTVSLFFISMSLVVFCLVVCSVDYVPLIGEIIPYLSFTAWLISRSIMLSSSIHAVVKGRSSFFLSAV